MPQARVLALITLSTLAITSCSDGYVPPTGAVIIDGPAPNMPDPAGSAGVEISGPDGPLIEGGQPVTVSVRLRRAPTAAVTLQVSSGNPSKGQVSPDALTFSPESWSLAQELVVTPVDNDIADGDVSWPLRFSIQSEDASFAAESVAPLVLTTVDNDVAPQLVATFAGAPITTEAGASASLRVVLSRQPSSEVLVPVRVDDPTEAAASAASLSFTPLTWNLPQELVLTGIDDQLKDGDVRYSVTLGPANSADAAFNGIGPLTLSLTNLDGVCGNGVLDGQEACEPKPGAQTTCDFGQRECMVCSDACEYVQGNVSGFCGDGVVQFEQGEECDGSASCLVQGIATCSSSCRIDRTRCTTFTSVTAGRRHTCGLLSNGDLVCRGDNTYQQLPDLTSGVLSITAQDLATCISTGQQVRCYGDAYDRSINGPLKSLKVRSFRLSDLSPSALLSEVCGLTEAGQIRCDSNKTRTTGAPAGTGFKDIAVAVLLNCALRSNGRPQCWDLNEMNTAIPDVEMTAIAGASGVCGLRASDGSIVCWGSRLSPGPGAGFTALSLGSSRAGEYGCAVSPQGITCWGGRPANTPSFEAGHFIDVAAGDEHVCAVRADGASTCWGSDSFNQHL